MRIIHLLTTGVISLGLIGTTTVKAQETSKSSGGNTVSVTGCLAQGDSANEFSIKDENGKTYGLLSSRVSLKEHLGHKVTITGTPTKASSGGEKGEKKSAKSGGSEESEHLRVSNLTMVSTTCP